MDLRPSTPSPTRTRTYFHDITSGNNGYPAGTGYDMATGIGSPIANLLIPALAPASAVPDLTVSMTDSGSGVFHPGDVGDTFTITVSNSGTAATSGTVSLADALPAGLTATAFSGDGWTVNFATLTATRNDPLAAGSSYPALTLTVNVATSASGSLTNTATVSGGGEINTANDTATDTVAITRARLDRQHDRFRLRCFPPRRRRRHVHHHRDQLRHGGDQRHGEPGRTRCRRD